jgi:dolichol-phosphate mannosyltransferase
MSESADAVGKDGATRRRKISVVTSAYNEEECVDELTRRLQAVFAIMPQYDFEVIAVDNGSADSTFERLDRTAEIDARFVVVQLARNFRTDGGITAGLEFANGDAVVIMTADLQDPPEMIPELVAKWEEGYENVYGIVATRRHSSLLRRVNSRLFYWVIARFTGQMIPPNASDFRILDRRAYEQVREMRERNRFIRGLVAWMGFRSIGVPFDRPERFAGRSKAHTLYVLRLAVKAIFAHSLVPIMVIPVVGFGLFVISICTLIGLTIDWVLNGVPFPGFGSIISVIILLFGILFCILGVIGIYVALIYEEVKARPNFVIRRMSRVLEAEYGGGVPSGTSGISRK